MDVACDYCGNAARLVGGDVIYPHRPDLYAKRFWRCAECDAYVGCHAAGNGYGDGDRPLGRLANAELREAKSAAHASFDPLWESRKISRKGAYAILAQELGIGVDSCHIGNFDVDTCRAVISLKPKLVWRILNARQVNK